MRSCGWGAGGLNKPQGKGWQEEEEQEWGDVILFRDPGAEQVTLGQSRAMDVSVLSQGASAALLSQHWGVPFANACRGSKPVEKTIQGSCREPNWVPWLIQRRFIIQQLKIVLQVDAGLQVVPARGDRVRGWSECKCGERGVPGWGSEH